jgi:putative ABC transport system permease protein
MALSVILLAGAGLLVRTLVRLYSVDPGYETANSLRFDLVLPEAAYPELPAITHFYEDLLERIQTLPGVSSTGAAFGAPLGSWGMGADVLVEGRPVPADGEETGAQLRSVTPTYLGTLGIRPIRGREIQATDGLGDEPVAVVNETFVRQNFPGEDPIGERIRITGSHGFGSPYWTIVGIVPDVLSVSLTRGPIAEVYVPQSQMGPGYMTVLVRTEPGAGPILPQIREIVQSLDSDLPLRSVTTTQALVAEEFAQTRFLMALLGVFAVLALALASVGLSGVVSYLVSQRHQEIGIRLALGARGNSVVTMVLKQAAGPTLVGLAIGMTAALAGGRVLERFLFQVDPRDPLVLAGVILVLLATAALAALLPARRAGRVDPVQVLASE